MNNNQSQIDNISSELLNYNNTNEQYINQMLSTELIIANDSFIPFIETTTIAAGSSYIRHGQTNNNITTRQLGRRRRRQRRRQRRQQQQREEQQRQLQQQGLRQVQVQPLTFESRYRRSRMSFDTRWDHDDWDYLDFPEYMDARSPDSLLESYNWDTMDPKER